MNKSVSQLTQSTGEIPANSQQKTPQIEPSFSLPVIKVLSLFILMLAASILTQFLPWQQWQMPPESDKGLLLASGSIVIMWAIIFVAIQPWKRRPASEWMLWWLGSTVVQMLGAPILLLSIYFFSHLPAVSVLVGGVVWAMIGLLAEAVIVAKSVSRQAIIHK